MRLILSRISHFNGIDNLDKYISQLDENRRQRVLSQKNEDNKLRTLIAGLHIRKVCEECGCEHKLEYNEHGKPYVADSNIRFNISHSGDYVACAFGTEEVGVDVQQNKEMSDSLIRRFLNEAEAEAVFTNKAEAEICARTVKAYSYDNNCKQQLANRIWTIKEAYVKMLGIGLGVDMRDCIVDLDKKLVKNVTGQYCDGIFEEYILEDANIVVCQKNGALPAVIEWVDYI